MKDYYSLMFVAIFLLLFIQLPKVEAEKNVRSTDILAAEGYVAHIVNSDIKQEKEKEVVSECKCNGSKYVDNGGDGNLTRCQCGDNCNCSAGTGSAPVKTVLVPIAGTGWGKKPICSNPSCGMCYVQYQKKILENQSPNPQASSPVEERDKALAQLKLGQNDIFADIGCGDGNVLIEAVKRYGVKSAIGIEIDPIKANEARSNIRRAGLDSRIEIIEVDATKFDFSARGITAAYVYLYPDLLKSINFDGIGRIVSVYHDIPNLQTTQIGNNFFFQNNTRSLNEIYKKYYIIKFTADWCTPCISWNNIERKTLTDSGVKITEIDADTNNDILKKYNILSLPSFMICDIENEKILATHQGYQSAEFLLKNILEISNGLE
jgi:SAM-dependent methyltransferase